jgi:transcription antitermination factor NusG
VGEALSKAGLGTDRIGSGSEYATALNSSSAAWYAVQTLHRHEQRISRDLIVKGFHTYLPLLRETRQWTDRKKIIEVPAFSGYLFARYDACSRNRVRILETSGVVRMLGDNHSPVAIADFEIESLQRTLSSSVACQRCEYLTAGALVQVKSGPLAGIRGRLIRINHGLRLILSVSTVQQAISVEVDLKDVEPAVEGQALRVPPSLS